MDTPAYGSLPGIGSLTQNTESNIWWGREENLLHVQALILDSTAVDAGNSPTTDLRQGLLLGKKVADGNLYQYDPDANDGSEEVYAVLLRDISTLDANGTAEDKMIHALVGGPMRAETLRVEGTLLTSSDHEYTVRRQMANRFVFNDDPTSKAMHLGAAFSNKTETAAAITVAAADNGSRLVCSNAASTTVTLPAIHQGLVFEFLRTGDEEFIVTSAEGDNIIFGNDLSGDSITFTTAGQHIGALVRVEGIHVGGTLKWLMTVPHVPFGTGAAFLTYSIAT